MELEGTQGLPRTILCNVQEHQLSHSRDWLAKQNLIRTRRYFSLFFLKRATDFNKQQNVKIALLYNFGEGEVLYSTFNETL